MLHSRWFRWLLALVLVSCSPQTGETPPDRPAAEWRIVPGKSAGFITADVSEIELRKRYGEGAVESARIQIGEGETMPGAVLFGGDSLRRAEVIWRDSVDRRKPARLILRGSRSQWRTDAGITLGTPLHELERVNGRPFTLAGFGWDYGGVITDWAGGALSQQLPGTFLYLDPGPHQYESAEYSQVLGDRDYSSASASMQRLNPKVAQIFMDFE